MEFLRYFAGTTLRDLIDIVLSYTLIWGAFVALIGVVYVYARVVNFCERRRRTQSQRRG